MTTVQLAKQLQRTVRSCCSAGAVSAGARWRLRTLRNAALPEYDLVTVGSGLAGAALARTMARRGARVLVVERETKFRDRVRGEGMLPWGVREAKRLDLKEILVERCGHEVYQWTYHVSGRQLPPRDFHTTTPEGDPCLDFYHPEMQEVVLAAAAGAGANTPRGDRCRRHFWAAGDSNPDAWSHKRPC